MMKQWKILAAILIPLVVMALWTAYYAFIAGGGAEVRLKVRGYDPRDLLSGHYLVYRLDYENDFNCGGSLGVEDTKCVCWTNTRPAEVAWTGPCDKRPADCTLWLQGHCSGGQFAAGIERFYFPEKFASRLVSIPQHSTIGVRLNGRGQGVVRNFYVGDEPLLDYLRRNANRK